MKPVILAAAVADSSAVETLLAQPTFRKATRNMALAYAAVEALLAQLPAGWAAAHGADLSSVLGTSDGELDVTVQFLKIFGASKMARPFLFQSSLHNATLGFLSERFGWRGPGATLSGYDTSGEEALETAADWSLCSASPYAIAIGVDGLVEGAGQALSASYPTPVVLREGAAAVLFARPGVSEIAPLAVFEGWETTSGAPLPPGEPYYDSSAVEMLARALRAGTRPTEIRRHKPDGVVSVLRLGRG